MELFSKEIYTLVIPIKREKDQTFKYNAGPCTGNYKIHYEHLNKHGKVFWSWGLTNSGIKTSIKKRLPELIQKLGQFHDIDGKEVMINNFGFFYSSEDKTIKWKFKASSIRKKIDIVADEIKYMPNFRKENHYDNPYWNGDWLLIEELSTLDKPFKGRYNEDSRAYEFHGLDYYRNKQNKKVVFDTNRLTKGNAFLIQECS